MTTGPFYDAQTAYSSEASPSVDAPNFMFQDATLVGERTAWSPKRLLKFTSFSLFLLILLLPICFGGIHARVYLPAHMLVFALAAIYSFYSFRLERSFSKGTPSYWILIGLLSYIAYSILQGIFFSFALSDHPVLGKVSRIVNHTRFWSGIEELVFFVAVFFVVRAFVEINPKNLKRLSQAILFSGFIVSLIGLSHWFYDNGKLFWYYEPESVLISPRARWPFVNPNHLAHFLLLLFFAGVANFFVLYREIRSSRKFDTRGPAKILSGIAASDRLRSRFIGLSYLALMGFTVLLCIFGTLSRGGWLGLSLGTIIFLIGTTTLAHKNKTLACGARATDSSPRAPKSRRRSRNSQHQTTFNDLSNRSPSIIKVLGVVFAAVMLYLFLQGRGAELVEARIEYGLKYSKDDMRWQFYADTWSMVKDYPLFGVGLGAWSAQYPKYMQSSLSGVNPVYLHSEPLSALTESGAIGILPLVFVFFFVTFSTFRLLKSASYERGLLTLGLYSGLLAFLTASLLDFPLRMPAIAFLLAVELALLASCLDPIEASVKGEPVV